MREVEAFLRAVLPPVVACRGVASDLSRFERLTVAEAFARYANADVLGTAGDAAALAASACVRRREGEIGRICFSACCWSALSLASGRDHPDLSHALAGRTGGACPARSRGPSRGRAVRVVRVRDRVGECIRGADRPDRAARRASSLIAPVVTHSVARTGRLTRTFLPPWRTGCRRRPVSRLVSTGWQ